MDKPKIAIIVINYKNYVDKFLKGCVEGINNLDYPKDKLRLYVVDNVTTPQTRERIAEISSEVTIVPNEGNGWGSGNNAGVKQAIKDGFSDYFCLWNMDIDVDPQCLNRLIETFSTDEKIKLVSPKVFLYPKNAAQWQNPLLNSVGNKIHFLGFGFTDGYMLHDTEKKMTIEDIPYASGCGLIVEGKFFIDMGMCDEEFFMYHDDMELCWKARLLGYRTVINHKAVFYHKYEFNRSVGQVNYMERNRILVILLFYKLPSIILIIPAFLFMEAGMIVYSIFNGWFSKKMESYAYFLKPSSWRYILKNRKRYQSTRLVKDKDIFKYFTGKVEFQEIANPLLDKVANPILNLYWYIIKLFIFW